MNGFSWPVYLLAFLPESFLLTSIVVLLAGGRLRLREVLAIALLYTPVIVLLRQAFPPGVHSLFALFTVPLLISLFFKLTYRKALRSFVFIFAILIILETLTGLILHDYLSPLQFPWHYVLFALPVNLSLGFILFLLLHYDWKPLFEALIP